MRMKQLLGRIFCSVLALSIVWTLIHYAFPQDPDSLGGKAQTPNRKFAVLVGVRDYGGSLGTLQYTVMDAREMEATLKNELGFSPTNIHILASDEIEVLKRPNKKNILRALDEVCGQAKAGDLILVQLSGHGMQLNGNGKGIAVFCPEDVDRDDLYRTTIPLSEIQDKLNHSPATFKLFIVDACRTLPSKAPDLAPIETLNEPPFGMALLQSCGRGETSWDDKELEHGVFSHFLIRGLKGDADTDHDGQITLLELCKWVNPEVQRWVKQKYRDTQRPYFSCEMTDLILRTDVNIIIAMELF